MSIKIAGAIFDMDGTLVDSMGAWYNDGARYLARLGIEAEPNLGTKLFSANTYTGALYIRDRYGLDKTVEEVTKGLIDEMEWFYRNDAEFCPGAKELLDDFRAKGIPMTIVTSTDSGNVRLVLDKLGVLDYFLDIYSAGDLKMSKTEPDIFFMAAEKMGTKPEDTWVFEDGLYAVKVAKAAGFKTVGVYDAISDARSEELKRAADIYVDTLPDLPEFIIKRF